MRVLIDPRRPSRPGSRVGAGDLEELYAFPQRGTWVRANMVSTLDGAAAGTDGRSGSVNTPADNRVFALQRDLADVVLVGAGTVRAEGYRRLEPTRRSRVPATLAVVTRSGRVPENVRTGKEGRGPALLVTCRAAGERALDRARTVLGDDNVLVCGTDTVDLRAALVELSARRLRKVLLEGGPSLLSAALAADVVDELALTLAPTLVGGDATRITSGPTLSGTYGIPARPYALLEQAGTMLGLYRFHRAR
jgi:riboflavin biosynthesis pyrimidine reductase